MCLLKAGILLFFGTFIIIFKKKTNSLLLWLFIWYWSSCSSWKAAPHRSQGWGLSRAWVRRTWLSCAACEAKAFPQCLHLKGRSPECWRMCVRRILEAVKAWRRKRKRKKHSQRFIFVFFFWEVEFTVMATATLDYIGEDIFYISLLVGYF